jgi:hypothetical protein
VIKVMPDQQHNDTGDRSNELCDVSLRIQPERLTVIHGSQPTREAEHGCKEEADDEIVQITPTFPALSVKANEG